MVEAARLTVERCGTRCFVIAADVNYHTLGLYESLGFQRRERPCGVCRPTTLKCVVQRADLPGDGPRYG